MSQRLDTYRLDGGRCVACRKRLPRGGGVWSWHAHHVLKQQWLRRLVIPARIRDATFTVLVCHRCHGRHESRMEAIPLERLPARVVAAVEALGAAPAQMLRRYHPPSGA